MPRIDISRVPQRKGSGYPPPFNQASPTRIKQALGDAAGLTDFGVNLTQLPPGEWSSQRHWHECEDEFVYILSGEVVLKTDAGEEVLRSGDCAGFKKNVADGHHLINKSNSTAFYLEIGSRAENEVAHYPDVDLEWRGKVFRHKDGSDYSK